MIKKYLSTAERLGGSRGVVRGADDKHRKLLFDRLSYAESRPLICNGDGASHQNEDWEEVKLAKEEATEFRGAAARLNFQSQDRPELMSPAKEISQGMVNPVKGFPTYL